MLQTEQEASIAICSDSQAVIKGLQSVRTTSSLVVSMHLKNRHCSTMSG